MINPQDLPIDIHSNKLLDWLISRRHCQKDWQKDVLVVREKIKNAILDMPESDEIVELLQGAYINYFHCLRIVEILQDTEKDTRNFLGYYSSQRMKDWQEIQSLYKRNNLYLAESAQILQRIVQYEIPALKKQITKAEQTLEETVRKEKDYCKQAEDGRKIYEKELTRLGIQGHSLRAELLALAADLPSFFAKLTTEIVGLKEPYEYCVNFRHYVYQRSDLPVKLLPLISLILRRGVQPTTFEYKYGVAPDSVETPSYDLLLKRDKKPSNDDIDFCEDCIDFGDAESIEFPEDDLQIDVVADSSGLVVEAVARGEDALGVVENLTTQKVIRNELDELLAFLMMRKEDEERETSSDIFIQGFEKRPAEISKVSSSKLDSWISQVRAVLDQLRDPQKNYLVQIRSSPQYVEKLVEEIESKRELEGRYKKMQALMIEKQDEARKQITKVSQELQAVQNSTRTLQKQLEKDISMKYDGRKVNIVGGITAALASR
ncbi:hypothetical protein KIN20_000371 [Parelaphostrongylus tenuis]|uniref:CDK5 regulatory subunit-associated protein 3 n=1 Tax=Parelaphostrongylus tenuis TaxID=148309 RepID=A0AAD5MKJ6_PARTN|nr:hypothetical protein KIN20_000371 [Parelaphostrongylus tenuis]